MKSYLLILIVLLFVMNSCKTVTKIQIKNFMFDDVNVEYNSENSKGVVKYHSEFFVEAATFDSLNNEVLPGIGVEIFEGRKGGNVDIEYYGTKSTSRFACKSAKVHDSKDTMRINRILNNVKPYSKENGQKQLEQLATEMKFDANTDLRTFVDIQSQLGCLLIGNEVENELKIKEPIRLAEIKLKTVRTSKQKFSTVTERSIINSLKVAVPIYGSIESKMNNDYVHNVAWDIDYYNHTSDISISTLIVNLDAAEKKKLKSKLEFFKAHDIWVLREFDVLESCVFSVTEATEMGLIVDAAIASVVTTNNAYTFKAEESVFSSLPNKAYNTYYEKLGSVSDFISYLEGKDQEEKITSDIKKLNSVLEKGEE